MLQGELAADAERGGEGPVVRGAAAAALARGGVVVGWALEALDVEEMGGLQGAVGRAGETRGGEAEVMPGLGPSDAGPRDAPTLVLHLVEHHGSGPQLQAAGHQVAGGLRQALAQHLHEAQALRGAPAVQHLRQGPDVVASQPQGLDLGQLLGLGVAGHDAPQVVEGVVESVHARALASVGLDPPDANPLLSHFGHLLPLGAASFGKLLPVGPDHLLVVFFVFLHVVAAELRGALQAVCRQPTAPPHVRAVLSVHGANVVVQPAQGAHQLRHVPSLPERFGHHCDLEGRRRFPC